MDGCGKPDATDTVIANKVKAQFFRGQASISLPPALLPGEGERSPSIGKVTPGFRRVATGFFKHSRITEQSCRLSTENRQQDADQNADDGGQFFPAVHFMKEQQSAGERHQGIAAPEAHHHRDERIRLR